MTGSSLQSCQHALELPVEGQTHTVVFLVATDQSVVIQVHSHIAVERQTRAYADHRGIAIHRHALHSERAVAIGEGQMAVGIDVVQVVLPTEARTQLQLLLIRQGERTLGAHAEGRQHHIAVVLTPFNAAASPFSVKLSVLRCT